MREITTKTEMKQLYRMYYNYKYQLRRNGLQSITGYYKYPSDKKRRAWQYCKEQCYEKFNGNCLTVISGNTYEFTAGFLFFKDGEEYFAVITKSYDRCCKVKDLIKFDKSSKEEKKDDAKK